jgi:hypothetical protein
VHNLTGDIRAALVSAAIITLAPYRIEHVIHVELQWTVWTPPTLWALHRAHDESSIRFGALTGLFLCSCEGADLIPSGRYRDWVGGDTQIFERRHDGVSAPAPRLQR